MQCLCQAAFIGISSYHLLHLHLRLNLLHQLLQLVLVALLLWPLDAQTLLLVWLRDHVEVDLYNTNQWMLLI